MTRDEKIFGAGIMLIFTLLGTANVLLLPPYEGFDETGHYRISQFSQTDMKFQISPYAPGRNSRK